MSVRTTTQVATQPQEVLQVLADYDLHHSGSSQSPARSGLGNPDTTPVAESSNPSWWPTDHRRVPPHRPINHNLDPELRPAGSHLIETMFILTMLHGVNLNANLNNMWRATGGKLNDRIFRYKIGGEW